jgi:catalase
MRRSHFLGNFASLIAVASAACPVLSGENLGSKTPNPHQVEKRQSANASSETETFLSQFYLNDNNSYLTTDVGGPIEDQNSLKGGSRGPTLLEDFIFRQKIQHFDHERVSTPKLI